METAHENAPARGDTVAGDGRANQQAEAFAAFCAAGLWPGVGRGLAARLTDAGVRGPHDVTLERLAGVHGVGRERVRRLVASFERAVPAYDVVELFVGTGTPVPLAGAARTALGDGAAGELRVDPWRLLAVPGIRPPQADHFAKRLLSGPVSPADPRRGRALVAYLLARAARDGHTVQPPATLGRALRAHAIEDPRGAIEAALDDGSVVAFESYEKPEQEADEPRTLLGLGRLAMAEESLAEGLIRLRATAEPLGDPDDRADDEDGLDDAQREAVSAVARHGVSVLTGGPGTGKSRAVAAVVALAHSCDKRVALAAPTGRAAKRLEELTGAEATTLH
ncbi:MAG: AAA family ATPase, partial [Nocardioidaceae bacterium]